MSRIGTSRGSPTKTVLLAERDEAAGSVLQSTIADQGFKILLADSVERCLFLALQKNFDAFVLDLELPGGDPAGLCTRLRGIGRYKHTPIIFTASSPGAPELLSALEAGADDFLDKPINPVVAQARLRGHLHRMSYLREMEEIRANLNRYVSTRTQQVVEDHVVAGKLLEPEERHVCILFSDVRGFTALSREMSPSALFRMLSRHLAMQVDCVYRRGGYVDKFGGDGIMAIFDGENGVADACHCALEIMDTTRQTRGSDGPATLPLGIGLNSGPVLIGNIGSQEHLDYSAIGETVNLAARLCGSARPMSIVASERIVAAASGDAGLNFFDHQTVTVRGIQEPVSICSLERGEGIRPRTAQPSYASRQFDRRGA